MSAQNIKEKGVLALFGRTGECANSFAALALKSGFHIRALVRNPTRLREMLLS